MSNTSTAVAHAEDEFASAFARLARVFRSRGLSIEDAADLAQETVARTLAHLKRHGRRRDDLAPLFNTIAKHLLTEHFRTHGREIATELHRAPNDPDDDVEGAVMRIDRNRVIRQAIEQLPERQRRAMCMVLEGVEPADIASELGMKRNAFDVLMHRTRRALATRLDEWRDSAWGVGVLAATRARNAVRRAALFWTSTDPVSPAMAPVILTLSALIVVSGPFGPGRATPPERRAAVQTVSRAVHAATSGVIEAAAHDATRGATAATVDEDTYRPSDVGVNVRRQRVDAVTYVPNPQTGEPDDVGLRVYTEDDGREGFSGPLLQKASDLVCPSAPQLCEEE